MKTTISILALFLFSASLSSAITILSFTGFLRAYDGNSVLNLPDVAGTITYDETQLLGMGPEELFPPDISLSLNVLGESWGLPDDASFGTMPPISPLLFVDGVPLEFLFVVAENQAAFDALLAPNPPEPLDNPQAIINPTYQGFDVFADSFTVIPEPTAAVLVFATALLTLRRRR